MVAVARAHCAVGLLHSFEEYPSPLMCSVLDLNDQMLQEMHRMHHWHLEPGLHLLQLKPQELLVRKPKRTAVRV